MLFDADFATMLAARLAGRWRPGPEIIGLGKHLRRDLGLPPAHRPEMPVLWRHKL
jgi:hypothetical protein